MACGVTRSAEQNIAFSTFTRRDGHLIEEIRKIDFCRNVIRIPDRSIFFIELCREIIRSESDGIFPIICDEKASLYNIVGIKFDWRVRSKRAELNS